MLVEVVEQVAFTEGKGDHPAATGPYYSGPAASSICRKSNRPIAVFLPQERLKVERRGCAFNRPQPPFQCRFSVVEQMEPVSFPLFVHRRPKRIDHRRDGTFGRKVENRDEATGNRCC